MDEYLLFGATRKKTNSRREYFKRQRRSKQESKEGAPPQKQESEATSGVKSTGAIRRTSAMSAQARGPTGQKSAENSPYVGFPTEKNTLDEYLLFGATRKKTNSRREYRKKKQERKQESKEGEQPQKQESEATSGVKSTGAIRKTSAMSAQARGPTGQKSAENRPYVGFPTGKQSFKSSTLGPRFFRPPAFMPHELGPGLARPHASAPTGLGSVEAGRPCMRGNEFAEERRTGAWDPSRQAPAEARPSLWGLVDDEEEAGRPCKRGNEFAAERRAGVWETYRQARAEARPSGWGLVEDEDEAGAWVIDASYDPDRVDVLEPGCLRDPFDRRKIVKPPPGLTNRETLLWQKQTLTKHQYQKDWYADRAWRRVIKPWLPDEDFRQVDSDFKADCKVFSSFANLLIVDPGENPVVGTDQGLSQGGGHDLGFNVGQGVDREQGQGDGPNVPTGYGRSHCNTQDGGQQGAQGEWPVMQQEDWPDYGQGNEVEDEASLWT